MERADPTPPARRDSRVFRFPGFHAEDEPAFIAWLSERVTSPNPEAEAFKIAAYGYLRSQHLEPPATQRLRRLLRLAVGQREERLVRETAAQLSPATRHALDALIRLKRQRTLPTQSRCRYSLFGPNSP
jgi:hypothetical protein